MRQVSTSFDVDGWRLAANAVRLVASEGRPDGRPPNPYFVELYRTLAKALSDGGAGLFGMEGRAHTAQVEQTQREWREWRFRWGDDDQRRIKLIWSPDGADDIAAGGQANALGHGSGKTLFCRLIRYCLGEDRFATEAQRERIGTALLNGLVGAEVILDGICWAIVRPLGVRRRHMAVSNGNLEEIAAGEGSSTGLEPFIQAIEQSIITPGLAELIRPGTGGAVWPVALA